MVWKLEKDEFLTDGEVCNDDDETTGARVHLYHTAADVLWRIYQLYSESTEFRAKYDKNIGAFAVHYVTYIQLYCAFNCFDQCLQFGIITAEIEYAEKRTIQK